MTTRARDGRGERFGLLLKALWGGTTILLISPAVAMQLTDEVNWNLSDFAVATVLLFGSGSLIHLFVRSESSPFYRAGAAVAIGTAFIILWANAAVGLIGSEHDAPNGWFYGVVLFALFGTAASRIRARGLAVTMTLTGLMQMTIAALVTANDPRGGVFASSLGALWLLSAALLQISARVQSEGR